MTNQEAKAYSIEDFIWETEDQLGFRNKPCEAAFWNMIKAWKRMQASDHCDLFRSVQEHYHAGCNLLSTINFEYGLMYEVTQAELLSRMRDATKHFKNIIKNGWDGQELSWVRYWKQPGDPGYIEIE